LMIRPATTNALFLDKSGRTSIKDIIAKGKRKKKTIIWKLCQGVKRVKKKSRRHWKIALRRRRWLNRRKRRLKNWEISLKREEQI
jgi:hypothetical protein